MLPLRQLSEGFGVKQIDGIIGTTLFYHFLTTMDYPHGELVLRRKDAKNLEEFKKSPGKRVTSSNLDGWRSFHGCLGSRGDAPTVAPVH